MICRKIVSGKGKTPSNPDREITTGIKYWRRIYCTSCTCNLHVKKLFPVKIWNGGNSALKGHFSANKHQDNFHLLCKVNYKHLVMKFVISRLVNGLTFLAFSLTRFK